MSTRTTKLVACFTLVTAVATGWWYDTRSGTAAPIDLPTVLHGAPYLLDLYAADLASVDPADDLDGDGKKDKDPKPRKPDGPSGTSGTLGLQVLSFRTNGTTSINDCFPTSQGWDRYYSTQYFGGPFTKNIQFPNIENVSSVTVDTIHSSNGTTLATGIVIYKSVAPNIKVCATNAGTISPNNPNLSKATFAPTQTNTLYRTTIFYKSSTAGGLSNIFFNFSYP